MLKQGQLNLDDLDQPYAAVVQLRTQPQGVIHQVVLRPDKIKKIQRICQYGHAHDSGLIVLGETFGDQAAGWQYPENVYVVAVLGEAVPPVGNPNSIAEPWMCRQIVEKAA